MVKGSKFHVLESSERASRKGSTDGSHSNHLIVPSPMASRQSSVDLVQNGGGSVLAQAAVAGSVVTTFEDACEMNAQLKLMINNMFERAEAMIRDNAKMQKENEQIIKETREMHAEYQKLVALVSGLHGIEALALNPNLGEWPARD